MRASTKAVAVCWFSCYCVDAFCPFGSAITIRDSFDDRCYWRDTNVSLSISCDRCIIIVGENKNENLVRVIGTAEFEDHPKYSAMLHSVSISPLHKIVFPSSYGMELHVDTRTFCKWDQRNRKHIDIGWQIVCVCECVFSCRSYLCSQTFCGPNLVPLWAHICVIFIYIYKSICAYDRAFVFSGSRHRSISMWACLRICAKTYWFTFHMEWMQ